MPAVPSIVLFFQVLNSHSDIYGFISTQRHNQTPQATPARGWIMSLPMPYFQIPAEYFDTKMIQWLKLRFYESWTCKRERLLLVFIYTLISLFTLSSLEPFMDFQGPILFPVFLLLPTQHHLIWWQKYHFSGHCFSPATSLFRSLAGDCKGWKLTWYCREKKGMLTMQEMPLERLDEERSD